MTSSVGAALCGRPGGRQAACRNRAATQGAYRHPADRPYRKTGLFYLASLLDRREALARQGPARLLQHLPEAIALAARDQRLELGQGLPRGGVDLVPVRVEMLDVEIEIRILGQHREGRRRLAGERRRGAGVQLGGIDAGADQ